MTQLDPVCAPTAGPAPYSRHFRPVSRVCPECNETFETPSRKKTFCCDAHKLAFHNRNAARGKVLIPLAMAWRAGRGSGDTAKKAFAQLTSTLDRFVREDREAGRLPMAQYLQCSFARGHRD